MDAAGTNKLEKLIHYIIFRTKPEDLGAVRLNKVLWFSDVEHYKKYGRSITGLSDYLRLPQGPVPPRVRLMLKNLERRGAIKERSTQVYDFHRREFVWLEEPILDDFSATEISITDEVMRHICYNHTAQSISDYSHDFYWEEVPEIGLMSVGAASVSSRSATDDEMEWARTVY